MSRPMSRALYETTRFAVPTRSPSAHPAASFRLLHNGAGPQRAPPPLATGGAQPRSGSATGPSGETPQEKVARLRAEWRAKHVPPLPLWDRIVLRGRSMANTAHTVFTLSILGISVVLTVGYVYVMTDMFRYNRRKKREFFETQSVLYATALAESRAAVARGDARPEHLDVLENERLAVLEEERARGKRHVRDIYNYLFKRKDGGEEMADVPNEVEAARRRFPLPPPAEQQTAASKVLELRDAREAEARRGKEEGSVGAVVEAERRKGEKTAEARGVEGGLLDQVAAGLRPSAAASGSDQRSWFKRIWS